MIADGIHTNPAALRIAHRAHPQGKPLGRLGQVGCDQQGSEALSYPGLVLITDAVPALGLGNGRHTLGQMEVEVDGLMACIAGEYPLHSQKNSPLALPFREARIWYSLPG